MQKISQKSDDFFTVRSYLTDDGQDVIELWFEKQPPEIQAAFIVALGTLRKMPRKHWRGALYEPMGRRQAPCLGLARLRVIHKPPSKTGQEHQERILAYEDLSKKEVILLLVFSKNDDPDYSLMCPQAQERKTKAENDPNRTQECKY